MEPGSARERIKDFVLGLGADDVGIAAVSNYNSPRSPKIATIFPGTKSIIVLAYKELANCESPNVQIAMNGKLDQMEFSRLNNYKLARFLDKEFKAKGMTVPNSYPLDMSQKGIGDVSLRHAAVAAGLGQFGRHNLVIHPELGTRVTFTAVLCDLDLQSDPPATEDLCTHCNICVDNCPAGALDEEGKTDLLKCIKNSQPYSQFRTIAFWHQFIDSAPEEQKKMFLDESFRFMYQAASLGIQYFCFNCFKSCPVGQQP